MTAKIKIPTTEVIKAVERAKKAAERSHAGSVRKWERDYARWSRAASKALRDMAGVIGRSGVGDPWNNGSRGSSSSVVSVKVSLDWPGSRPELDGRFDRDLSYLKATDSTHITIDPDDRMDRFGAHFGASL